MAIYFYHEQVLEGLAHLLTSCDSEPPELIVISGDFCSRPYCGGEDYSAVILRFEGLAELFSQHPRLCTETRYLLVCVSPSLQVCICSWSQRPLWKSVANTSPASIASCIYSTTCFCSTKIDFCHQSC